MTFSNTSSWNVDSLLPGLEAAYRAARIPESWVQEKDAVREALLGIGNALTPGRYGLLRVLGVGGSGVVVRVSDMRFPSLDNALKFPRPVPGKIQLISGLLAKEIQYLAQLRHVNIVRILDYGEASEVPHYRRVPYYLMEAVDGTSSRQHIKDHSDASTLVRMVREAAATLCYLHSFHKGGFAHLDVKPGNFVVELSGRLVMIDLGTCKRLSMTDIDATTIACTQSFAHPDLVASLAEDQSDENSAKGEIPRSKIKPAWDLWSLGLTIASWMGLDPSSGKLEYKHTIASLDSYTRKYLFLIAARLLAGPHLPGWLSAHTGLSASFLERVRILNAEELLELVDRLAGASSPIEAVAEMRIAQTNTIQAAPGVHVSVTPALRDLLDHPLFRRLNSISQLGLVSQVYPGAKHSRHEHSIGTYANVQRMIRALYDDQSSPLFRQLISDRDLRALLLAALLHDLGYFPLAQILKR